MQTSDLHMMYTYFTDHAEKDIKLYNVFGAWRDSRVEILR